MDTLEREPQGQGKMKFRCADAGPKRAIGRSVEIANRKSCQRSSSMVAKSTT